MKRFWGFAFRGAPVRWRRMDLRWLETNARQDKKDVFLSFQVSSSSIISFPLVTIKARIQHTHTHRTFWILLNRNKIKRIWVSFMIKLFSEKWILPTGVLVVVVVYSAMATVFYNRAWFQFALLCMISNDISTLRQQ